MQICSTTSRTSGRSTTSSRATSATPTRSWRGSGARSRSSGSTCPAMPGEEGKPVFIVYRYEDIQQMLRDNETFSSSVVIQVFGDVLRQGVMLGMDEPVHGRLRSLVTKAFTQKALARWEDELVGRIGNELIDEFAADGKADLVKEFTFPYPTRIIAGAARPAGGGLPAVPALVDLVAELHRQPGTRHGGIAGAGGLLHADPGRPAGRTPRRSDQQPRRGRDRRPEALRRGDLLVPPAAAARRRGDHLPVAGQPAVRLVVRPRPTRRGPRRPLAAPAGDRGGGAVGAAAADDHPGRHPRHRTRRRGDPGGLVR